MTEQIGKCPFCGRKAKATVLPSGIVNIGCIGNVDGSCAVVMFGATETKAGMIAKWNKRIIARCRSCQQLVDLDDGHDCPGIASFRR